MAQDALNPDRRRLRGTFSRVGLAALLFILTNGAVGAAIPYLPLPLSQDLLTLLTYISLYALGTLLFYLSVRRLPRQITVRTALPFSGFITYLCVGYLFLIVGNLIGTAVSYALDAGSVVETYLLSTDAVVNIFPLVVLAPVCEELMFRKLLLDRTAQYGEREAVFLSALLFALMHGNFTQAFYAFGLGLVLAALYLRTHNLWYTIALHAFVNLMQGVVPALISQFSGDNALLLAPVTLLAFGLAIAGLVLFLVNRRNISLPTSTIPRVNALIYGNAGMILFLAAAAAMFAAVTYLSLQ